MVNTEHGKKWGQMTREIILKETYLVRYGDSGSLISQCVWMAKFAMLTKLKGNVFASIKNTIQ